MGNKNMAVKHRERRTAVNSGRTMVSHSMAMTTADASQRHAVMDVGTNSVKLLVADMGQSLKPLLELSRQTWLGQGAFCTGRLQPEAMARTVTAVAEFASKAIELRPASLRILATSATREATNAQELVQAIFNATGLTVEILSGDQEADYVLQGVTNDPAIGVRPVLVVDVGGGSTEWVVGNGGLTQFRQSTKLGTSRLLEMCPPGDPPTRGDLARCRRVIASFLRREVCPRLGPVLASFCGRRACLIGLGGTPKTIAWLASGQHPESEPPTLLRWGQMGEQIERLWGLSSRERRNLSGLNPEKADVILTGAVIYEAVMSQFKFTEMLMSKHEMGRGAVMSRATRVGTPRFSIAQQAPGPLLIGMRSEQNPAPAVAPPQTWTPASSAPAARQAK
jgi:exopolyphosphatase/guanosine-5'-triphosphate,3'-diphosphate pyrophosphatase